MPQNANGKKSAIENVLSAFCQKYNFPLKDIPFSFEGLKSELQIELSNSIKKEVVTKYVLGSNCFLFSRTY